MRTAVVGHHEWVSFMLVDHVPSSGEIVHADEWWEEPGGGGSNAAVQLRKLSGDAVLFTSFGDDETGHRGARRLGELGVRVEATFRPEKTRRAVTHIDSTGERTITVLGERLAPLASDPLPWDELDDVDAAYFTAGDAGALRHARRAGVLVATSRVLPVLTEAGVELDAVVGSRLDRSEMYRSGDIEPEPRLVVRTNGADGGTYMLRGEEPRRYQPVTPPGRVIDRYGAGDSFAGGLAFALASGHGPHEAVAFAARCGAAVVAGRGPHRGQLTSSDL